METNLVNCAQCGHSVSQTAKACAYCGAVVSEGEPTPQDGEIMAAEEAPPPEPKHSLQEEEPPKVVEKPEVSESAAAAVAEPAESDFSDPLSAETADMEIPESPMVAEPANAGEDVVIELSNRGQATENQQEASPGSSEVEEDSQGVLDDMVESVDMPHLVPESNVELSQEEIASKAEMIDSNGDVPGESEKQIESETAPSEPSGFIEPDIIEMAEDESSISDSLGAEVIEIAEVGAQPSPEMVLPDDKAPAEASTNLVQDMPLVTSEDIDPEPEAVVKEDDSEEETLLTLTEEVELPLEDGSEGGDEYLSMNTAEIIAEIAKDDSMRKSKSDAKPPVDNVFSEAEASPKSEETQLAPDILKIERAAQDMADAVQKQKAAMAKARTKEQKDLDLARADAAKRKKVALARYQALKKERKSQAKIDVLKKEGAAAPTDIAKDSLPTIAPNLEAETNLVGLLNKYEGQTVGINYENSAEIKEAEFVEANEEFFSVFVKDKELRYSFPLNTILAVVEGKNGIGGSDSHQETIVNAVLKLYPSMH